MRNVRIDRSWRVQCRAELDLPLPASAAWGQLRDFRRSASHDYFHADVRIAGTPRQGSALVLEHRYLLFHVRRVGRILRWREWREAGAAPDDGGRRTGSMSRSAGYSFSDLSPAGARAGFPHVFSYFLNATSPDACRLEVVVRGLWTARAVPRWAARLWLAWVFHHLVNSIRNSLLVSAAHHRALRRASAPGWTRPAAPLHSRRAADPP